MFVYDFNKLKFFYNNNLGDYYFYFYSFNTCHLLILFMFIFFCAFVMRSSHFGLHVSHAFT